MMMASAKIDVENKFKDLSDLFYQKVEMFCLKCRIKRVQGCKLRHLRFN
jgi:hypothetical protein